MIVLLFILKSAVGTGILFGYYRLFLRNKRFHHYNRFYLLITLLLPPLLALINIPVSLQPGNRANEVLIRTVDALTIKSRMTARAPAVSSGEWWHIGWQSISVAAYAIVSLALALLLLRGLLYIRQLRKRFPSQPFNELCLYHTNEPGTPFSFFQSIFWNNDIAIDSKEGQQIFRHEYFHVQQKHSADILLAELVSVIFWINPFVHLVKKEIRAIHEFLADQYAIHNNDGSEYATILLQRIMHSQQLGGTNYFFQNHIKRRIAMITQLKNKKYGYASRVMVLPLAILLFFGISLYAQKNQLLQLSPVAAEPSANTSADTIPHAKRQKMEQTLKELELKKARIVAEQKKQLEIIERQQELLRSQIGDNMLHRQELELKSDARMEELKLIELDSKREAEKLSLVQDEHELLSLKKRAEYEQVQQEKMHHEKLLLKERQGSSLNDERKKIELKELKLRQERDADQLLMKQQTELLRLKEKQALTGQKKLQEIQLLLSDEQAALAMAKRNAELEKMENKSSTQRLRLTHSSMTDTLLHKLQRHFNKNLRYPALALHANKEGEVYISFDLNKKAEVTDYVLHAGMPTTNGQMIYEIVVVSYESKNVEDANESAIQDALNAEVARTLKAYRPASDAVISPQRVYFKIKFHLEKN